MNNIFSFYGADEKVGTTMITQMIADKISDDYPDKKVLYLHLCGRTGTDFTVQVFVWCIDDLKPKLISGVFKENEFSSFCEKKNNLDTLRGSKSYLNRKFYMPEQIIAFLNKISPLYDIVIVDAGGNIEDGMILGCLLATENNILVAGQLRKALSMYTTVNEQVLKQLNITFKGAILNKFIASPDFPDDPTVEEQLDIPLIGIIPYSSNGFLAEMEQKTLSAYKERNIHVALKQICENIEIAAGFREENNKKEFKGISKFFTRR